MESNMSGSDPQLGQGSTKPPGSPGTPPKKAVTPQEKSTNIGALEKVVLRNNFYRDNYRRLMIVCLGLIMLCAALIFWGFYERSHEPPPQYFATTYDGKLIPLTPLSVPSLAPNALLQWARDAAVASYTYNYVNYRKALQDVRIYFTRKGYNYFSKALLDSNNLIAVQNRKLLVSATPTGAGQILKQGIVQGVYMWTVQLPMQIQFRNEKETITQDIILIMTISRIPTLEAPSGVGIDSYVIITPGKAQ